MATQQRSKPGITREHGLAATVAVTVTIRDRNGQYQGGGFSHCEEFPGLRLDQIGHLVDRAAGVLEFLTPEAPPESFREVWEAEALTEADRFQQTRGYGGRI